MRSSTIIRTAVLLCAVIALALSVLGVFMPFFEMPASVESTLDTLNATIHSPSFDIETDKATLERFGLLAGGPPGKSKMTLWKLIYATSKAGTPVDLREDYFTCFHGNMLIQTAEGMSVVSCVLAAANVIMAIFLFFFSAVVKFPLAMYFFLAAAAAAVTCGVALHLYLHGWCNTPSLKACEWNLSVGFAFFVVSSGVSLIASALTMCAH
ncbi:hypothetical protein LSCM1_03396 [Leishmania martiniquensis]|uniref:Amastin-like surface protein-like protein n=1 Tax=Leishmania martiniquensis TaxID=1580590 RepID=A0A836KR95_9TRYP|nr:hypothetical protein LSCM1_03396 [Leishmania martiniquensis]